MSTPRKKNQTPDDPNGPWNDFAGETAVPDGPWNDYADEIATPKKKVPTPRRPSIRRRLRVRCITTRPGTSVLSSPLVRK